MLQPTCNASTNSVLGNIETCLTTTSTTSNVTEIEKASYSECEIQTLHCGGGPANKADMSRRVSFSKKKKVVASRANSSEVPQQGNFIDCGPHTILSAEDCLLDKTLNANIHRLKRTRNQNKETIDGVRKRIISVLQEVLKNDNVQPRERKRKATEVNDDSNSSETSKPKEATGTHHSERQKRKKGKFGKKKLEKSAVEETQSLDPVPVLYQNSSVEVKTPLTVLRDIDEVISSTTDRKTLKALHQARNIIQKVIEPSPEESPEFPSSESSG
ncbi:hypothetical protein CAEBREN_30222 [Caenorhabditis brenneri]|uniref:Uncharacterized protein n=1 Tax=Caenorhabditis brenneri TaxID=135651 RepID=G0MH37_CAEBE|nr:hypothetical protein CAEBREN_30222 [Caenorhabditis brenneri]